MSAAYVLDATLDEPGAPHCFVPVELGPDGEVESIVFGMNYLSSDPPNGGRFVGVIHADGQEAVDAWCEANQEEVDRLAAA